MLTINVLSKDIKNEKYNNDNNDNNNNNNDNKKKRLKIFPPIFFFFFFFTAKKVETDAERTRVHKEWKVRIRYSYV